MKYIILSFASVLILCSCKNPAESSTEARVTEARAASSIAGTGVKWTLSDSSTINFIGSKVTGSHEGGFKTFSGYFHVDGKTLAPGGHQVVIDMNSTYSDAEKLTGHLKSADFFGVETYPQSAFTVTELKEQAGEKGETHLLTGNLEFHGVTKSIEMPATVEASDEAIRVTADFFINRFDFNIKYPGKKDDLIRKEVVIRFDLNATPAETVPSN